MFNDLQWNPPRLDRHTFFLDSDGRCRSCGHPADDDVHTRTPAAPEANNPMSLLEDAMKKLRVARMCSANPSYKIELSTEEAIAIANEVDWLRLQMEELAKSDPIEPEEEGGYTDGFQEHP